MHHKNDSDRALARQRADSAARTKLRSHRPRRAFVAARAAGLVLISALLAVPASGVVAPSVVSAMGALDFFRQEAHREARRPDPAPGGGGLLQRLFEPQPAPRQAAPAPQAQPRQERAAPRAPTTQASLGQRTICVRLCDGYAFPIGDLERVRDLALHDLACNASCPGAPTKVFTLEPGAEDFENARAEDGTRYADLPVAYAYRNAIDGACSCQGPNRRVADRLDIRKDMTLRRGDIVVTQDGPIVYQGRDGDPRDLSDFAAFDDARMPRSLRAMADARLGVSHNRALAEEHERRMAEIAATTPAATASIAGPVEGETVLAAQ